MDNIKAFREIAKVGKSFLKSIVGINETTTDFKTVKDYSKCSAECPLSNYTSNLDGHISDYCKKHCKYVISNSSSDSISISNTKRLSKSQIKQLMYYHFLNVDERGIISHVNMDDIAEFIGCNRKTVENNNRRFAELNYIYYTKINENCYNILIFGYKNYYLTKEEGGTGYINVAKELLESFNKISEVNALRLEIRKLLKDDNDSIKSKYISQLSNSSEILSEYKFDDLKRFLPSHINYKSAIENAVCGATEAFYTRIKDNIIQFRLNEEYDAELLKHEKQVLFAESIKNYCEKHLILMDSKLKEDLIQMGLEYGLSCVLKALEIYKTDYVDNNKVVDNIGGLIRNIIRLAFIKKISA